MLEEKSQTNTLLNIVQTCENVLYYIWEAMWSESLNRKRHESAQVFKYTTVALEISPGMSNKV